MGLEKPSLIDMIGFVWVMSHFGVGLDGFQGGFCCRMELGRIMEEK